MNRNSIIFTQENALQIVVCKNGDHFEQCVGGGGGVIDSDIKYITYDMHRFAVLCFSEKSKTIKRIKILDSLWLSYAK